jgi:hypothetical protein
MPNVIKRLRANARAILCIKVLVITIACSMGQPGSAQVSGRFLGTVTAESGATLPNATVTLRNSNTGSVRRTKTNELGAFEILAVSAAERDGFRSIKDDTDHGRNFVRITSRIFNLFNHGQFLNPMGNFIASNFGQVTAARDPRFGQLSAKFVF